MLRSSCVPPRARNAHSRIANATPPRIVGAGGRERDVDRRDERSARLPRDVRPTVDRDPGHACGSGARRRARIAAAAIRASTPMSVPGSALRPTSALRRSVPGETFLTSAGFGSTPFCGLGDRRPFLRRGRDLAARVDAAGRVGRGRACPDAGAGAASVRRRRCCRRCRTCRRCRRAVAAGGVAAGVVVFGLAVLSAMARVSTSRQSPYSSSSVGMLLRAVRIAEAE